MFRSVLVANRGEIAVRVIATLRRMGIRSVIAHSTPDRQSLAVREADDAVLLEGSSPTDTYLNIEAVLAAARASGCEAIHPGYGFLSENPAFAERCAASGVVFIGPPAAVLVRMGDKARARQLAQEAGVPVVPGWGGDDADQTLLARAADIGFPLMVKARGGGGGRGMRAVASLAELPEALRSARREAESAFGDSRLLLERLVVGAHHVEVQILADGQGNVVHLGERDCSVQRRHQKLIEETPSPVVDERLRAELTTAAVQLARSIGYVNAGTFEFLVDSPGQTNGRRPFYFLEVNPRLQVEHPVTEMVTGVDLVELQVRVAAGERLPFVQSDVTFTGHSLECRLNAEDPWNGFVPSNGRLQQFEAPFGRFDVGFADGDVVPTQYDSLIGKLIFHGEDRAATVARALAGLASTDTWPLRTTVPLHRSILASDDFRAGTASVEWLEDNLTELLSEAKAPATFWIAAAGELTRAAGEGPFAGLGWIGAGDASVWLDDGTGREPLSVQSQRDGTGLARFRGETFPFELTAHGVRIGSNRFDSARDASVVRMTAGARRFSFRIVPPPPPERQLRSGGVAGAIVSAPLSGTIVRVDVAKGDTVDAGQTLVLIEAMKMEHRVVAPASGTIATVNVTGGEVVSEGQVLVELEQ